MRIAHREAKPVGGRHRHLAGVDFKQHAREHRPGIVGGGGKHDLVDHLPDVADAQDQIALQVAGRHRGELLGVDALDIVVRCAARTLRSDADGQVISWSLGARRRVGGSSRDRRGALLLDLGSDPAGDPQLQVGGRKAQSAAVGGDEYIGQDRKRAARLNGPGDQGETPGQILLQAGDLHRRACPYGA
jgi:hypothetical protein